MSMATFDEEKLRELMKSALIEALEERGDFVREIVAEVIEDIALARAIEQGLESEPISRNEVFAILNYHLLLY